MAAVRRGVLLGVFAAGSFAVAADPPPPVPVMPAAPVLPPAPPPAPVGPVPAPGALSFQPLNPAGPPAPVIPDATDYLTGKKPIPPDLLLPPPAKAVAPPPVVQVGGPPLVFSPSADVVFDYEVTRKGASGVKEVRVWVTTDGGKAWQPKATARAGEPLRANLGADGRYGVRLSAVSGAGVAARDPSPGDGPDLVVVVDATPPAVKLASARHSEDGWLVSAEVADLNLDPDTVRLQWRDADKPGGDWQDAPKEAVTARPSAAPWQFKWRWAPDRTAPARVMLRVTAGDRAGNVVAAAAAEPVATDLVIPQGRLTGVRPAPPKPPEPLPAIPPLPPGK